MREGREGVIPVFAGLPATNPRWTVAAEDYLTGSARLTINDRVRIGSLTPPEVDSWTVENGLVRLSPSDTLDGGVLVESWDAAGGEWASPHRFRFWNSADNYLTAAPEMVVLRNEPEEVVIRLQFPRSSGRVTVDLGLRRGSRFVTGVLKRHSAVTMSVEREGGVPIDSPTGGVRQTDADASGNRFVMGSSKPATTGFASTSFMWHQSSVTAFDFFIGYEVGDPAQAGDAFADLLAQYLGSTGERSRPVKRA
jgi:hypothetical protein